MVNIKEFLKEKISNWYRNAVDYGATGKFIDCGVVEGDLIIVFQENGQKLKCEIPCCEEYSADQIYNIWMEVEWEVIA